MSEGKKKILITGSTGFIGRNVKEYLEKNPVYRVYAPASRELDCMDETAVRAYLEENRADDSYRSVWTDEIYSGAADRGQ